MAAKVSIKTTFDIAKTISPIYTGGDVSSNASGTLLATTVDEDVLVVDIKSAKPLLRIEGDDEAVTSICLSPTVSHLVISSRSLSMRIYELSSVPGAGKLTAQLVRTLKPHTTPVVVSSIDATGSLLATGGADGTVKVWDLRGGYVSHTFHGHRGVVSALEFFQTSLSVEAKKGRKRKSRDNADVEMDDAPIESVMCLASGGEDGKIRIWNLNTRKSIAILDAHASVVRSLRYSPEQELLLSASRDKTIILWNARSWKSRTVIPALEVLEAAGFTMEGKYCYGGGEDGALRVWNTSNGQVVTEGQKSGLETDAIIAIVDIPGEQTLLSIHLDQMMKFQSYEALVDASPVTRSKPLPILRRISGNHDEIIDMVCVGPDRSLLALATNTESIRLISIQENITGGDQSNSLNEFGADVALLEGHEDIVICLDVDWSGHWLATGAKDNTARLWRLDPKSSTYRCFATFAGHAESIEAIALPRTRPTSGKPASDPLNHPPEFFLTGSQDKTIKRWDTSKLAVTTSSDLPHNGMRALYTRVAHEKDINALDVSPITPIFASASKDRTIKLWSLEDGSTVNILRGHKRGVWSIRFSPANTPPLNLSDGGTSGLRGLLLSGSGDRTVKVWSLSTYTCLLTFEGHSNSVLKVIWLPPPPQTDSEDSTTSHQQVRNNPMIASASQDTLVKLWSPYTSSDSDPLLTTLDNHTDRVWALTTPLTPSTPLSSYPLISGAADATITFWRDTTTQTATLATQRASERVEQDQLLQNHIHAKNYREVITLALALNHPGRLLRCFEDVVNLPSSDRDEDSITGSRAVDDVLASLSHEQLFKLLERVRDWNTNARTAPVAQKVLSCVLKRYPAGVWLEMAKERRIGEKGKGMRELLRALEVYTERHFRRMEELMDESYVLEYTLREMDEVAGTVAMNGNGTGNRDEDVIMI